MIRGHTQTARPALSISAVKAVVELWHGSGKTSVISVSGRSMLPFIQSGDKLLVSHDKRRARIGDVVTFYQGGVLVVHRVISHKTRHGKTLILTKGDNSPGFDPPIRPDDIVGRVVALDRDGLQLLFNAPGRRISGWAIVLKTMMCKHFAAVLRPNYLTRLKRFLKRCFTTLRESN